MIGQTYTFTGTKIGIFTWKGCVLDVSSESTAGYVASETPMLSYLNLHFALEGMRDKSESSGQDGPRVLIVGPENSGKTTLAKILTSYAIKQGRPLTVANMDPKMVIIGDYFKFINSNFIRVCLHYHAP